jgi:hypothetical protein
LAFLRNGNSNECSLEPWWHQDIDSWTPDELRDVGEEAERNTSILTLGVWVWNDMTEGTAETIASAIHRFKNINTVEVLR